MSQAAGLAQRSISAALWGVSGSALQLVLQLAIQVVLARLLGPEQYGLFALAAVVIALGGFFTYGLPTALIQKRSVSDADVRFVNFWQLALGAAAASVLCLAADSFAAFFHEARVGPVIRALSIVCLIQALSATAGALLQRNLDFRSTQLAALASYAFGYGLLGIPLALAGYGVDALVAAFVAQALAMAAFQYWRQPHARGLVLWHADASALWRYGATVCATHVNNWALMHLPRVVVGRVFPSTAVGLYALAYNFVSQLASAVTGVQAPLFSAAARVQDEPQRQRRLFLTMLAATALIAAPAFAGIAAASETLVLALYGEAWRESAPLLCAFALGMPFFIATAMGTPMLWTSGRTTQELRFQLPIAVALAAAALLAAPHSLGAVAWAVAGVFVLRFVVITAAACIALGVRARELAAALRPGIAATVAVAGAIALVDGLASQVTGRAAAVLALDIGTGFAVQLLVLRFAGPWFTPELAVLREHLLSRIQFR